MHISLLHKVTEKKSALKMSLNQEVARKARSEMAKEQGWKLIPYTHIVESWEQKGIRIDYFPKKDRVVCTIQPLGKTKEFKKVGGNAGLEKYFKSAVLNNPLDS